MSASSEPSACRPTRPPLAAIFLIAALSVLAGFGAARSASQYTPKQIELYAQYVGKTYWVVEEKTPDFHTAPAPGAPVFRPALKESFEIKEIVGGAAPYYRVAFDSGKEGFIPVRLFSEELNAAFASSDPDRDAKAKSAKEAAAEKKRREWILAQKWSEPVKQAALKKQAVLGMSTAEARAVLGKPKRQVTIKTTTSLMGRQQQWTYDDSVLTFTDGIITRIQPAEPPTVGK